MVESKVRSQMTYGQETGTLIARVAVRDRKAIVELYKATSSKLYGVILRIVKRKDIADEVLQEVYVKVWEKAADFDATRASPIAWMSAIARNRALDEVRRKHPASAEDHPEIQNLASDDKSALDLVLLGEDGRRLADCLARLEPDRRHMVVFAYCEGLSREELAVKYGQPVNTIKTWLRRSLAQLRGCLGA